MDSTAQRRVDDQRVGYLEQLGETLILRGLYAAVAHPAGGAPFLRVTNPALTQMSDTVFCVLAEDGTWEYCWPWDAPIGPAEDLARAADAVARVLTAEANAR